MAIKEKIDVDEVLVTLRQFGKYQLFLFAVILYGKLFHPFILFSFFFIGYQSPFRCDEVNQSKLIINDVSLSANYSYVLSYKECHIDVYHNDTNGTFVSKTSCINGYKFDIPDDRTFTSEWGLVCENRGLAELTQTLMMLGKGLGSFVLPQLSDKFGRLRLHWVCSIGLIFLAIATGFCKNMIQMSIVRVLLGFMQQGAALSGYIYLLEFVPQNARMYVEIATMTVWVTGMVLTGCVAYLMQNLSWRYFQIAFSLGSCHVFVIYWILDESLRWLIANGKAEEAEKVIRKAARWNKVNYEELITKAKDRARERTLTLAETDVSVQDGIENDVRKYNFIDMLKNRRILMTSFIVWYIWISVAFGYYGLTLTSSTLSDDRFLSFILSSIVEFPVVFIEYFLLNRIGRKKVCVMFSAFTALALIIATVLQSHKGDNKGLKTASFIFSLIGKFAVAGTFSVVFMYTPELYPTNLRNVGFGTASAFGRIGSMAAPFAGLLAHHVLWGPSVIIGSMFCLATLLVYYLPETMGRELPTTIEELQEWHKGGKTQTKSNVLSDI